MPKIFAQYCMVDDPHGEETVKEIALPDLWQRQALNAQDPMSSCHHYLFFMYVILPTVFGLRMCFMCPDCNADGTDFNSKQEEIACSDCMGCNSKLMGGYAGLGTGMAFATEYQGEATPHGHGFVSLANMYQHHSLEEIGAIIERNAAGISAEVMLERVTHLCEHLQREDHFDNEQHQRNLPELEKQFHANNSGPTENIFLSVRPSPLYDTTEAPCMWESNRPSQRLLRRVQEEAVEFQKKYEMDVQFIFSRVQHHWHHLDEKGQRVPLKYCRLKGRKSHKFCKSGFPKKVLKNRDGTLKKEKYRVRIVCQGVAAEMDLKTSGRRNALGSILGRRRCAYFSGTSALLAAVSRSNTNVQCNYRVPISEATHDKDCHSKKCCKASSGRRLCLIAQRAMKQMTGYFGGYISKRQKIGQFELKKSISALPLLQQKLEHRNVRSASTQLAHVTNRMFTTLEGKGILRASTEEFMLASQHKPHDQLAGEFIRTFRERHFLGKYYLDRYDALCEKKGEVDVRVLLPRNGCGPDVPDEVALYGFRSTIPDVFFLSPWEFCQWFKPHRLRPPKQGEYDWSKFTKTGVEKLRDSQGQKITWESGVDFVLNEEVVSNLPFLFPYPATKILFGSQGNATYTLFRNTWLLIRRERPVIPCPERCPMPGKRMSKDTRSKVFTIGKPRVGVASPLHFTMRTKGGFPPPLRFIMGIKGGFVSPLRFIMG